MQNTQDLTIKDLAKNCHSVEEVQEMLKNLFKDTLQQIFEAEMDEHLGYKKHSPQGDNSGNSRNGYNKKTIKTRFGNSEIAIPRDRNGEFEPKIIKKYETTSNQIEEQIIAMYCQRDVYPGHRRPYAGHLRYRRFPQYGQQDNR